jgi:hypothetical protein
MCLPALAAEDHVFYYQGNVRWIDLTGRTSVKSDQQMILKKEVLPSKGIIVETATMVNYQGKMCDSRTEMAVRGNTVVARTADGMIVGMGQIRGVSSDGDFDYLNLTLVVVPTGSVVKNINYITPTQLIARKEIDDSQGKSTALWEADLNLMSKDEFDSLYKKLNSTGVCN